MAVTSCHQRRGMYSASPARSAHSQRGTAARRGSPASSCAAAHPDLNVSKINSFPAWHARQAQTLHSPAARHQTLAGKPCDSAQHARQARVPHIQLRGTTTSRPQLNISHAMHKGNCGCDQNHLNLAGKPCSCERPAAARLRGVAQRVLAVHAAVETLRRARLRGVAQRVVAVGRERSGVLGRVLAHRLRAPRLAEQVEVGVAVQRRARASRAQPHAALVHAPGHLPAAVSCVGPLSTVHKSCSVSYFILPTDTCAYSGASTVSVLLLAQDVPSLQMESTSIALAWHQLTWRSWVVQTADHMHCQGGLFSAGSGPKDCHTEHSKVMPN